MTKEEWEKEPDEYKREWDSGWIKRVLTRGQALRFTPPKLSDDEKEIAINRTVTSMAVKIRMNLIETRAGRTITQAQTGRKLNGNAAALASEPMTADSVYHDCFSETSSQYKEVSAWQEFSAWRPCEEI
jgi:hypothetical protein